MANSTQVLLELKADPNDLLRGVQEAINALNQLQSQFNKFGQAGTGQAAGGLREQLLGRKGELEAELNRLQDRVDRLNKARAEGKGVGRQTIGGVDFPQLGKNQLQDDAKIGEERLRLDQARKAIIAEINALEKQGAQEALNYRERMLALAVRDRRLAADPEAGLASALRERLIKARDLTNELIRQRAILREQVREQIPEREARKIEAGGLARKQERAAAEEVAKIEAELANLAVRRATEEAKAIPNLQAQNALLREQADLQLRLRSAREDQATAQRRQQQPDARMEVAERLSAASGYGQYLEEQINLLEEVSRVAGKEDLLAPDIASFRETASLIQRLQGSLKGIEVGSQEWEQTQNSINSLYAQQEKTLDSIANKGLPKITSFEQLREQQLAQMPALEKTLIGAFSDMTRRFQATLQFAISGALIFGVQQLIREFVQTAIEVERAFKDIESALEFDISAPRGSQEFKSTVNSVRLEVLALANEFNVLPSEANKAAYVMVSRFGNVENALKATRAQLLATKISTIDQSEVLRALTAIAEGFAAAVVETNSALTIQQRLLKRESVAAELYGKALDYAVYIQQQFGIEVEDTLEGTARANEAFRQLGFTMEETGAIVAAVSRQLGQTGVNVAERLVRSIGQINSPQIRDELLELAAASKELVLSPADFNSGKRAWEAIVSQIERIQQLEPATAQRILQIIGQRREIEAVAAALGSQDLQRAILVSADSAAGAAEKRYSFLADTVSETLKSIAAEFQTLAQNLEQLGVLNPLKLFLETADLTLSAVNGIITAIDSLINLLGKIPVINDLLDLPQAVKSAISLTVAFASLGRLAKGASRAFDFFQAGKGRLLGAVTGGVAGQLALPGMGKANLEFVKFSAVLAATRREGKGLTTAFVRFNRAILANTAVMIKNTFARASETVGRGIQNVLFTPTRGLIMTKSAQAIGAAFLKTAGIAVAAGSALYSLQQASQAAAERMEAFTARIADITLEVRSEQETEGFGEEEARRRIAQRSLAAAYDTQASVLSPGFLEKFAAAVDRLIELFENAALTSPLESPPNLPYGQDPRDFGFPGLPDKPFQTQVESRLRDYYSSLFSQMNAMIAQAVAAGAELTPGDTPSEIQDRINAIIEQMPSLDQEQLEALRFPIESYFVLVQDFLAENNLTLDSIRGTIETYRRELQTITEDNEFGQISDSAAVEMMRAMQESIAADIEGWKLSDDVQAPQIIAELESLSREISRKAVEALKSGLGGETIELIGDPVERSRQQMILAQRELEILSEEYGRNSTAARQAAVAVAQATRAYQEARYNQLVGAAEYKVQRARTTEQQIAAQRELAKTVANASANLVPGTEAWTAAMQRYFLEIEQLNRLLYEQGKALASARVRLGGPILNEINRINADIAAAKKDIEFFGANSTEGILAQIQIAELVAERTQQAARDAAAMRLSSVSMRDSLGRLNVELENAAAEMKIIGDLFGTTSDAFGQAKDAVEAAKIAVADALLELDTLNRILALADPSSSYERAVIERRGVEERLQAPDLGPLEKARLQVELIDAQLAEEQAFYQDRLGILAFQYESEAISKGQYLDYLTRLRDQTDTTTQQGRELWMEINGLIEGLTDDMSNMAFNIPDSIRLPTLFEVRRAVEADQLGVNYVDSRQQNINIYVSEVADAGDLAAAISSALGDAAYKEASRYAPGAAGISATPRVFY